MTIEAAVVLVRQRNHFRITRALRPLFLLGQNLIIFISILEENQLLVKI